MINSQPNAAFIASEIKRCFYSLGPNLKRKRSTSTAVLLCPFTPCSLFFMPFLTNLVPNLWVYPEKSPSFQVLSTTYLVCSWNLPKQKPFKERFLKPSTCEGGWMVIAKHAWLHCSNPSDCFVNQRGPLYTCKTETNKPFFFFHLDWQ